MTKEEAILWMQVLKHSKINWVGEKDEEEDIIKRCEEAEQEAFDIAIEALQDRPTPCEKCIHVKSCRKVIILKNRTYKLIKYCSQGAERREP